MSLNSIILPQPPIFIINSSCPKKKTYLSFVGLLYVQFTIYHIPSLIFVYLPPSTLYFGNWDSTIRYSCHSSPKNRIGIPSSSFPILCIIMSKPKKPTQKIFSIFVIQFNSLNSKLPFFLHPIRFNNEIEKSYTTMHYCIAYVLENVCIGLT